MGWIAVIQRGECRFDLTAQTGINAEYDGTIVFDSPGDELFITMGGDVCNIPGVFVGHSTGPAIFDVDSAEELTVGDTGGSIETAVEPERRGRVLFFTMLSIPGNDVSMGTKRAINGREWSWVREDLIAVG